MTKIDLPNLHCFHFLELHNMVCVEESRGEINLLIKYTILSVHGKEYKIYLINIREFIR